MVWSLNLLAVAVVFTVLNATSVIIQIKGLEIEDAYEQVCLDPRPNVARNVDYAWMYAVPRWYIPLQSKLNLYRYSETLLKTRAVNITQEQVDNSCITFKFDTPPIIYGFEDKTVGYITTNVIENTYGFNTRWEGDVRGRHYFTLRDNKSFVFFTTCWDDKKASWSVISTQDSLGEDTKAEILEHAKSLGFQEEFFVETSYVACPKIGDVDGNLDKNEL